MPLRRRPSAGGLLLAALVFVMVGLFAVTFGVSDAISARAFQYRLVGVMFALAGLTMVAAAACLSHVRWSRSYGREAAALAGAAGIGIGGYLLITQLTAPKTGPGSLLWSADILRWASIALASAGAAWFAWRVTRAAADVPQDATPADQGAMADSATNLARSRMVRNLTRGLVSFGISASLLWGAVQFWYTNQYVPGTLGAAVSITTELKEQQLPNAGTGERIFSGVITTKNVSATKVQIVSSVYTVTRVPESRVYQPSAEEFFERFLPSGGNARVSRNLPPHCEQINLLQDDFPVSRYYTQYREDLGRIKTLELGKVIDDGAYFEPSEDYTRHFLVHVPFDPEFSDARSKLSLSVRLLVAKGQRLVLADQESHGPEHVRTMVESEYERCHRDADVPYDYVVTEWPIQPLSRIRELAAGRQAVNIILTLRTRAHPDGSNGSTVLFDNPSLTLCVDRVGRFEHSSEHAPIRNDPTRVCPGLLEIARQPDYDRRMRGFYGIVGTSAMNEVALP